MTDRYEVAELADRQQARQRRGEAWDLEFEIEFGGLTDEQPACPPARDRAAWAPRGRVHRADEREGCPQRGTP